MGLFKRKERELEISWPIESNREPLPSDPPPETNDDKKSAIKQKGKRPEISWPIESKRMSQQSDHSSDAENPKMRFFRKKDKRPEISWPIESNRMSQQSDPLSLSSSAASENESSISDTSSKSQFHIASKLFGHRRERHRRSIAEATSFPHTTVSENEVDSTPTSSGASSRRTSSLFQFLPRWHTGPSGDDFTEVDCGGHDELSSPCKPPDQKALDAAADIPIFDESGNSRLFSSLYEGPQAIGEQQLIIFIRHFYCGACQAYLKTLSSEITLDTYFTLPIPTSITIIGLGSPSLISGYRELTNTPFPIYTDPSRRLYKALGMTWSLSLGKQPGYFEDANAAQWLIGQLRQMKGEEKKLRWKGGNWWWVGGEFLVRDGKVVWCNRMRTMRGHSEMGVVRKLVGADESTETTDDCSD